MEDLNVYVDASELIDWAKANLDIIKLNSEMTDSDIREVVRWIGISSIDTLYLDGDKPIIRRLGLGMMISITLLSFPDYYARHELGQFN